MTGVEERHTPFLPAAAPEGRAKVFMHGGSQAVRLPKAFRVEGDEVTVRREGDRVILEPIRKKSIPTPEERAAFWAKFDAGRRDDDLLVRPPQPEFHDYKFE